jgi:hypothetical protein
MGGFIHSAFAQDVIKLLAPNFQSAGTTPQGSLQNQPYMIRWGDLSLLATTTVEAEWNDNITLSESQREEDYIIRPKVNVQGALPLTDVNGFNLTLGLGYEAYTQHPNDSRLLVTPGSALSFDLLLDEFRINIHDRVTYENDPSLYGNISGIVRIGGLFNTAGASVVRDAGNFTATLGFDRLDFVSSTAEFNSLNNSSDFGTARLAYRPQAAVAVGVESGGGCTLYNEDLLSGYDTYSVGVFAQWQLTSRLQLIGRAGFLDYNYDTPTLTEGHSSIPGYYVFLSAAGNLNPHLSYSLQGGHSVTVSVDGGVIQQWYVALNSACEIIQHGVLNASIRYENALQPFENSFQEVNEAATFAPTYERVVAQLAFSYPLAKRLNASLSYSLQLKDSPSGIGNYTQNDVIVGLTYRL